MLSAKRFLCQWQKTLTVDSGEPIIHYPIPKNDIQGAQIVASGCRAHSTKKLVEALLYLLAIPEMTPRTGEVNSPLAASVAWRVGTG